MGGYLAGLIDFFLFVLILIAIVAAATFIWMFYSWLRRKMNKPRIGFESFLRDLLERGDYVSINGKVMKFSHIAEYGEPLDPLRPLNPKSHYNNTYRGELAFDDSISTNYHYYHPQALMKCDFIYGKYGLKWAASKELAGIAEERIKDY